MEAEPKKSKNCCWSLLVSVIAALGIAAFLLNFWRNFNHYGSRDSSDSRSPDAITEKYADALKIDMQFFNVQTSGKLVNNKIAWRGNSGLEDGKEGNLDLSKGMYDAVDHMKFGFPLAFTTIILSWAIIEYGDHMKTVGEIEHAQDSLKWITDYLINSHPLNDVLYIRFFSFS